MWDDTAIKGLLMGKVDLKELNIGDVVDRQRALLSFKLA